MSVGVVVTWDGRRPEWLSAALRSIDVQAPVPVERCLVVDAPDASARTTAPDALRRNGWTVRYGDWRDPAAARDEGMAVTRAPWLVFWDADNVMPAGYLAAVREAIRHATTDIAILYPDIEYVDENLGHGRRWRVPDWEYWSLRKGNYIDTASAWRREAVELAGGWPRGFGSSEDYALALEVTRRGWRARRRAGPPILMRQHSTSRSETRARTGDRAADLWQARSLAVVSLLAGRTSTYERWEGFLRTAELPRHTALYVVDNSGDREFTARVHATCQELSVTRDLDHISVSVRPDRYAGAADEPYFVRARHLHIARLYAGLLPTVGEDLVLTLEDDVEPPSDAVRRLGEHLAVHAEHNYAVVAGAYDMGDGALCAGRPDGGWGSPIYWAQVSDQPIDVGCVGGGCTLWANWALAGQPVSFLWNDGLGWDGSLCTALRRRGYRIQVHGAVRCTHHVHGIVRAS
jgi:hypothetical protein